MNIPNYVEESHKVFWPQFSNWCHNNGVENNPIDMEAWWDCFIAGATAMYLKVKAKEIEI